MNGRRGVLLCTVALLFLLLACSRSPGLPKGIDPAKLQAVQTQVDFPVAVPHYLPLGLRMVGADVLTTPPEVPVAGGKEEIHMSFFAYPDGPGLQFSQSDKFGEVTPGRPEGWTQVKVRGGWGYLYEDPYREGRTYLDLLWPGENGVSFYLWGYLDRGLSREMFLRIAESVR